MKTIKARSNNLDKEVIGRVVYIDCPKVPLHGHEYKKRCPKIIYRYHPELIPARFIKDKIVCIDWGVPHHFIKSGVKGIIWTFSPGPCEEDQPPPRFEEVFSPK